MKVFRNIRQNLLAQGRVTRYMTFALGEIVPVAIGFFYSPPLLPTPPNTGFRRSKVAGLLTISKTSKIVNAILRAPLTPEGESARAGKTKIR